MSLCYIDREMRIGDQGSRITLIIYLGNYLKEQVCFDIIFDTALESNGSSKLILFPS